MANTFLRGTKERTYFARLNKNSQSGKIDNHMEQFWICALLGLVHDEPKKPGKSSYGMVDHFTGKTVNHNDLICAFMFYRYVERNEFTEEEDDIMKALKIIFTETNSSNAKLTETGYDTISRYAAGGFELIQEKIGQVNDRATFLIKYVDLLLNLPGVCPECRSGNLTPDGEKLVCGTCGLIVDK